MNLDSPGRTVTLVEDSSGSCWGVAYRVADNLVEETLAYLNFRERAGYRREQVRFCPDDGSAPFQLSVYISMPAAEGNIYHAGPTDETEIVRTVSAVAEILLETVGENFRIFSETSEYLSIKL